VSDKMSDGSSSHRYHFNLSGLIKEIAYPNKAIIQVSFFAFSNVIYGQNLKRTK
jgi:hypothetical protein